MAKSKAPGPKPRLVIDRPLSFDKTGRAQITQDEATSISPVGYNSGIPVILVYQGTNYAAKVAFGAVASWVSCPKLKNNGE